MRNQL